MLAASKVGGVAAFARRKGQDWFVGIISGNEKEAVTLDKVALPFLGDEKTHLRLGGRRHQAG